MIDISNWMPTKNLTVVTKEQMMFIYKIGRFLPFDFGGMAYDCIERTGVCTTPTRILPFSILIYGMLKYQGFEEDMDCILSTTGSRLDISAGLVSENRVKDLSYHPLVNNTDDVVENQASSKQKYDHHDTDQMMASPEDIDAFIDDFNFDNGDAVDHVD